MPKNAEIHIQNSAPGPPVVMAPVTPMILPGPTRIAVERNGEIVPKRLYGETVLQDNDVIEVVSFVGGG